MFQRTLLVLLGFVIYVNGQYESSYCDMCPINLKLKTENKVDVCSKVVYSCTCSCSSGCVLSNNQNVGMGYKLTDLNIEEVTKQINACSTCFIFWNSWNCVLQSVYDVSSIKFDVCQHSSDFIKYNKNCVGNTFVSPSPVGFERYSPSIIRSPSPKVEVVASPQIVVRSPSPKVDVVSSTPMVMSPSPKVEVVASPQIVVRSPSPKVDVVASISPVTARSPVVSSSPSLRNRTSTGNDTDIISDNDIRAASLAFAWWIITLIVVGCLVVIGLLICLIMCCVQCCRR